MKNSIIKFIIVYFCFITIFGLQSCRDEDLNFLDSPTENVPEGDVITFSMTLDHMGGLVTRAENLKALELRELENYVDLTKVRVLFFDNDDKFLFESKSRWVKLMDPQLDHEVWSISVPLYTYGNDKDYDWEWKKIREVLVNNKFKIAVLVNRPDYEFLPGLDGNSLGANWYDNSGPDWTRKNSAVYEGSDRQIKDVFDLHHCQYDPLYHNKSVEDNGGGDAYDFIMDDWATGKPTLGASSSWVDFENGDTKRDKYGWDYRYAKLPSKDHPIPMYGIQEFQPLDGWKEGTTINLDRDEDKPISLLRSVVKLELILQKDFADDVLIFYGNWWARCEPMDVWTPTDQIWHQEHLSTDNWKDIDWKTNDNNYKNTCEWGRIWKSPRIAHQDRVGINLDGTEAYKKALMWVYGIWKKSGKWSFDKNIGTPSTKNPNTTRAKLDQYFDTNFGNLSEYQFPRIFNPCIQRLNKIMVEPTYSDGTFDHYIVYTGERNVNDPTRLYEIGSTGAGNSPVLYWTVVKGTIKPRNPSPTEKNQAKWEYTEGDTYSFPLVDYNYNKANVFNCTRKGTLKADYEVKQGSNVLYTVKAPENGAYNTKGQEQGTGMGDYLRRIAGIKEQPSDQSLRTNDSWSVYEGYDVPIPLLRNHVYTIKVTTTSTRNDGSIDLNISSDFFSTEDICFKK